MDMANNLGGWPSPAVTSNLESKCQWFSLKVAPLLLKLDIWFKSYTLNGSPGSGGGNSHSKVLLSDAAIRKTYSQVTKFAVLQIGPLIYALTCSSFTYMTSYIWANMSSFSYDRLDIQFDI